ncbi:MAG: hypothetical protein CM1200mP18_11630 [Gammaproteobacteria bacterium]|nr:MAG: hypothetical protein CM1200mP18_11630 [Gammaproteobacteria bacterium]
MTYKFFYALGSAAMGTRVILEEIGAPYELIQTTISMDEPRPPEQLKLNPNGWVPVLVWGERRCMSAPLLPFSCVIVTRKHNWHPPLTMRNGAHIFRR